MRATPTSRFVVNAITAGALLLGMAIAGACRSIPTPTAPDAIVSPLESRIDAIPGRTLVVPVELGRRFDARTPIQVRLGDGRPLAASIHRVAVRPEDPTGLWLPPAGHWEVAPVQDALKTPLPAGTMISWMLVVPLPASAGGQAIRIANRQVAVNWLPPLDAPGTVRSSDEKVLGPIILRTTPTTPATERLLDPERTSPARRWRYRLYTDGLSRAPDTVGQRLRFDDPVLEAIAVQNEDRWGYALRLLRQSNEDLAMRLARRLAMVADFGAGIVAPVWPTSQGDLVSLLSGLLDPRFDVERRAARAQAWLDAQTPAVGWITDDAGAQDAAGGGTLTAAGLVNLSDRPVAAFASPASGGHASTVAALAPGLVERMFIAWPVETPADPLALDLRVGRWSSTAPLLGKVAAAPPGVAVGPFSPDFSLDTWVLNAQSDHAGPRPDPLWLTAGMLYRRSGLVAGSPAEWLLHLECLHPAGDAPATADEPSREDTLRIWIGLSGSPRLVLRVGESGYAHIESSPGLVDPSATAESLGIAVISTPAKWVCQIPIPSTCLEADGTLRLGLERIDTRARRSAFPRPMLPWQTEPGRIAMTTSAW